MNQDEALEILKNGHNVFITGAAGSGKTYLLNKFIEHLRKEGVSVGVTASTGIAATHMEGITIHSWAGIGVMRSSTDREIQKIVENKRIAKRFQKTHTLIIDEVSMLDADRFDLIEKVARLSRGNWEPFGGMQVVLCGDFFQLPPVTTANEPEMKFIYESPNWNNMNLKVCYLEGQYRQGDEELLILLNSIREATVDDAVVERLRRSRNTVFPTMDSNRVVRLYSHNANVDLENQSELAKIPGEPHKFIMASSGNPAIVEALRRGCLAPENLVLKKGASVMFVKNNFEKGYVNGSLGTVIGFNEAGFPVVTLMNKTEIVAELATWEVEENGRMLAQTKQVPLRLAWAITVHKSQGMTLDAAQVDLTRCFQRGMGYVALSRVRSLKGLKVLGFNRMALEVDEATLVYDETLKKNSEQALRELESMAERKIERAANLEPSRIDQLRETHASAYKKWTVEEEERLKTGFISGQSYEALGEMIGRQVGGIQSRLKKLGLIQWDSEKQEYVKANPTENTISKSGNPSL